MSRTAKIVIVLTVVGIVSGLSLAEVYKRAEPLIKQQQLKRLKEAIFTVLPEAKDYRVEKKNGLIIYRGLDKDKNPAGIAFKVKGPGFQGTILLMVGLNNSMDKLLGMEVLESVETPGLGGKITTGKFKDQFKGLSVKPEITYVKNRNPATPKKPGQIDAITGATISSNAVVTMLNKKIDKVLKTFK
ncbi:MAG: RnfABCDGE type electron transport complex subunit G [Spirochaetes bacterium]|nr:RnfABCDGE type electron transport complex subunit G [Spirochaetota bacterium]